MLLLTKEELKSNKDAKIYQICGGRILEKIAKSKNYQKVRDHCHCTCKYRGTAHSICNSKFTVPNEIPVVFHNVSDHDCHFIIKELSNEFEEQFQCFGENQKKHKTFSVPTEV